MKAFSQTLMSHLTIWIWRSLAPHRGLIDNVFCHKFHFTITEINIDEEIKLRNAFGPISSLNVRCLRLDSAFFWRQLNWSLDGACFSNKHHVQRQSRDAGNITNVAPFSGVVGVKHRFETAVANSRTLTKQLLIILTETIPPKCISSTVNNTDDMKSPDCFRHSASQKSCNGKAATIFLSLHFLTSNEN